MGAAYMGMWAVWGQRVGGVQRRERSEGCMGWEAERRGDVPLSVGCVGIAYNCVGVSHSSNVGATYSGVGVGGCVEAAWGWR